MILIIGHRADPHLQSVAQSLTRNGSPFIVLDAYDDSSDGITYAVSEKVDLTLAGGSFPLLDVKAVWWRQKPKFEVPSQSAASLYDYYFMHREWNHLLEYIGRQLDGVFSINMPRNAVTASNKIYQLQHASSLGLRVPSTLISNDSDRIQAFVQSAPDKKHIFKTFSAYMSPEGKVTYTTIIDPDILAKKKDFLRVSPGIFQEFIEKAFELRITIVGSEVFSARIASNHSEKAAVDWRSDIFADLYTPFKLDDALESTLIRFHHALGLHYGAYDFAVNMDGEPIFLEVNPAGQWMWLEMNLGFPIGERIASALAAAAGAD